MTITLTFPGRGKRRNWPALLVLALVVGVSAGLLVPSGSVARACSCMPPPPPAQAVDESDVVFDGTVARIETIDPADGFSALRVDFVVHTQWKGVTEGRVSVLTAGDGATCGVYFELGRRYIVYARDTEPHGRLETHLCTRTGPWAEDEAIALGPGEPPDDAVSWTEWIPQPPAPGCPRCAEPPAPAQALAEAAAVFHGRLIGIQDLGPDQGHDHVVTFENRGWWKGRRSASIDVFLPWEYWFCEGERWKSLFQPDAPDGYIVYTAEDDAGNLILKICGRTRSWTAQEAAALGNPNAPDLATATPTASSSSGTPTPGLTATPTLGPGHPVRSVGEPVAHFGGRIRAVAPVPGSDLAWLAQGPRVMAVSLGRGEDLQRYGAGLMLPGQVEALAVDGLRGAALVGSTLHLLDLSDPTQPAVTAHVELDGLDGDLGPLRLLDGLSKALIADGPRLTLIDLDSGAITASDVEICGIGDRLIDLVVSDRMLAISSAGALPAYPSQTAKLQIVDPMEFGNPGGCVAVSSELDDSAVGNLALADVAGQPRLYSMAAGGIAGWDMTSLDALTEVARWSPDWRTEGFDPNQGDIAVTSAGEIYAALHRWVGSSYTAGEVLRVLATPDPTTGRSTETLHRSLRPLDAPLVVADDVGGVGRLMMAGPEGLSTFLAGDYNPRTVPLVTDAIDLALHLDDPGPVLYATSDKASLVGHLLLDPLAPDPYTFLLGEGAERGGLTVDDDRLVIANLGQTDIRDQKLEIVTVGGARVPAKQSEIDLLDAGPGLHWDQSGSRLVVRHGTELVLYDLSDPSLPVQAARAEIAGHVVELIVEGDWVYALHFFETLSELPGTPALTQLSVLRIDRANGGLQLNLMSGFTALPFLVYQDDVPLAVLDSDRQVLWMTGAVHLLPGDPRYKLSGLDVSDPSAPASILWGWADLSTRPEALAYGDGHLFVGGEQLLVVDVRDPDLPITCGELEVEGAGSLVVHEQTVYAAAGVDGVYILQPDLAWDSDPNAPTPTPTNGTGGPGRTIYLPWLFNRE